ncbi:MAG: D-alanyl-D-alanine carboxypeptidase [Candidatus Levybacteria bacterium]|nr:D-alanyl-D-alanine carboxypeptidase [Candidatus Levybacteria bacterium]
MKDFHQYLKKIRKQTRVLLYIFLFFSLLVLVTASIFDIFLRQYIFEEKLNEFPINISSDLYPVLASKINYPITAKAAVIMDSDSKVVLFSKNPNLLFSMASTTKIMTALIALDYYKMGDVLTIRTDNVEGVSVGFQKEQKFFFKDILYAMLLPSGNDAALALAQNYPNGEYAFVEKMNEKARKLHLDNTNFADTAGLKDREDYTTVLDLAKLASYAIQNKTFAEIVATKEVSFSDITGENNYRVYNLNKLLGVYGVNGIKTGYTDEAGQVLVTSKMEGDNTIIVVVMGSEDRFSDTEKLLNLISDNINYLSIHP